ncbi:hypothetical protein TNCV_3441721 [Trichonephila clavipes]|nr:hypothetical protein TNCV_3441721 [Trichonephila clavipes]
MFSEALRHPLYTLNCTVLPPAFCDWLFNSEVENIVGRVAQYVDEHYPVDKWHLGDLIAWVAQSALKYRPRICELYSQSALKSTKDDRVSQEIAPHTVTPCEIAVCRSTINAGSFTAGRCAFRHVCGGHQH